MNRKMEYWTNIFLGILLLIMALLIILIPSMDLRVPLGATTALLAARFLLYP